MPALLHQLSEVGGLSPPLPGGTPRSNLEMMDLILSGAARGPLADFILGRSGCPQARAPDAARGRPRPRGPDPAAEVAEILARSLPEAPSLAERACKNLEGNGAHCHLVEDPSEVGEIVAEVAGSARRVVKSLDLTLEESRLGESLAARGVDVWDASFPSALSSLSQAGADPDLLSSFLSEAASAPVEGSPAEAAAFLMREVLASAEVGLTGAAVLAADPGALFLLPRDPFDRLVSMTPEVHVAVVGLEGVIPTYREAFRVARLGLTRCRLPFLGVVAGPSKTGDIEKRVTYGAHGPRELHVVVVDGGRSSASADPDLSPVLACSGVCGLPCPWAWASWRRILGLGAPAPARPPPPPGCPMGWGVSPGRGVSLSAP